MDQPTAGYKSSEFWVVASVLSVWALQMMGVDVNALFHKAQTAADEVNLLVNQLHAGETPWAMIVAAIYVGSRPYLKKLHLDSSKVAGLPQVLQIIKEYEEAKNPKVILQESALNQ